MSYPTGSQIRDKLPVEDPAVSEARCDEIVAEWKAEVVEAAGGVDRETARTRRIVRRGAWAEAMQELMEVSGYIADAEMVADTLEWAEEALEKYDAENTSSTEASSVRLTALPWGTPARWVWDPDREIWYSA